MIVVVAQLLFGFGPLALWIYVVPCWLLRGHPPRSLPRFLRRVLAGVKWVLTWPGRSQAERYAGQIALRLQLREHDPRYRELMILGKMTVEALNGDEILVRRDGRGVQVARTAVLPEGFVPPSGALLSQDALVDLAAGRPPAVAGPELWAPGRIAAMSTTRCNACPVWGCPAQGDNPECIDAAHAYRPSCGCDRCSDVVSYEAVTTHEQIEPVAYVPTGRAAWDRTASNPDHVAEAQRMIEEALRDRAAADRLAAVLGIARLPKPGDDEIAKSPRDEFDAHTPPKRVRPPEERLAASLPCPFCGGQPMMMGREVSEDGELRTAWQEVHRKRCALYKRPPRRPRPSGAQRRKLRDRIEVAVAEQLAKDARQLGPQGRAELGLLAASLRRERDKGRQADAMWPYEPGPPDRVRR